MRPGEIETVGRRLSSLREVGWLAEAGVGTIHVAVGEAATLHACREVAHDVGGWLLREAGAPGLDGFGRPLPSIELAARVRHAFDPAAKLAPGRLPLPLVEVEGPIR